MLSIRTLVLIPVALVAADYETCSTITSYCSPESKYCVVNDDGGDAKCTAMKCEDLGDAHCTDSDSERNLKGYDEVCNKKCACGLVKKKTEGWASTFLKVAEFKQKCEDAGCKADNVEEKYPGTKCEKETCTCSKTYEVKPDCYANCTTEQYEHADNNKGHCMKDSTDKVGARCAKKNTKDYSGFWWVPNKCDDRTKESTHCDSGKPLNQNTESNTWQQCKVGGYACEQANEDYTSSSGTNIVQALEIPDDGAAQICISGVFCLLLAMML